MSINPPAALSRPDSPRKLQIVGTAARLFQEHGFHKVSMEDIAQAVGLRGPALYRHFRGKQQLLARVVLDQITVCLEVADRAAARAGTPQQRLDQFIDELGRLVLDRDEVMLWRWERRYLDEESQIEFRRRARRLEESTASVLRGVRPDLDGQQIELLSWAMLSTFAHTRGFRNGGDSANDRHRALNLLVQMAGSVVAGDLGRATPDEAPLPARHYLPTGRRERVLETATRLFNDRGFYEVSIEDIAAESDTAIATIYQYFESKSSLLYTILDRGVDGVNYLTAHLLAGVEDDEARVAALILNYVDLAMGPHGRLFRIFDEDLMALSEQQRSELLFTQRGHIDEWIGALQRLHPETTVFEARARARTATGIACDITQTSRLRGRPSTREALVSLLGSVVGI